MLLRSIICAVISATALASPSSKDIEELCAIADGPQHCGRLIEKSVLHRFPKLAERQGDRLEITLPRGKNLTFEDQETAAHYRYYSLWTFFPNIDYAVLFVQQEKNSRYLLISMRNGQRFELAADPLLSPDQRRLATADVCAQQCSGEIALWQVQGDRIRKERSWQAKSDWLDADLQWKDASTLVVSYRIGSADKLYELKLSDPGWKAHD